MYDELIQSLRQCAEASCAGCKNDLVQIGCRGLLQHEAADAIEELQADKAALNGTVTNLLEQIAELSKPRWISVTERLPPAEKEVYVTDGEYIARANLLDEVFPGDKPCWSYSGLGEITHWCEQIPLPEPPKEVRNGDT